MIAVGRFDELLARRAAGLLPHVHALQRRLALRVRERFEPFFQGDSLALAARYLMPGRGRFNFAHFNVDPQVLGQVRERMLDDVVALLRPGTAATVAQQLRLSAAPQLTMARELLDELDPNTEALEWWPQQAEILGPLFPLAKMLLAIPATSADNERAFSSAAYTLGERRTRIELEAFRSEHRIRRFIVADADGTSQAGRQKRLDRVAGLMDRFAALVAARPAAQ